LIDPRSGKFTAHAFVGGMLSSLGHNPTFAVRDFGGEVNFNPAEPDGASVKLTIQAASLELTDEFSGRDRWDIMHVMTDEVLEVSQHPEIVYDSRAGQIALKRAADSLFEAALKGTLTLHGVTRHQPVTAHIVAREDSLRAYGEVVLRQPDYDLKHVTVAGSMMKVKEEVKLTFDLVARKQ
jgi:polyisoprenoid-binding protein YceI